MKAYIFALILHLHYQCINCFFENPLNSSLNYTTRNLTCSSGFYQIINGTLSPRFGYSSVVDGAQYCVLTQYIPVSNYSSPVFLDFSLIGLVNNLRNFAVHRCGFSPSRDIGYGSLCVKIL